MEIRCFFAGKRMTLRPKRKALRAQPHEKLDHLKAEANQRLDDWLKARGTEAGPWKKFDELKVQAAEGLDELKAP